jgi:hypothetical protein
MSFKEFIKDEELNEAQVQVAGDKKPSGALVLAKVILEELEKKNLIKLGGPGPKRKLITEIQSLIIKSTF